MRYYLECLQCHERYDSSYDRQICKKCGGLLEVCYIGEIPSIKSSGSYWEYEPVLPECCYRHYELGSTKLIRSQEYDNVFLKLEIENPTHSFKDRGSIIEVCKAASYGKTEIAIASTGNMAYSVAYYAKLAGMCVRTFISSDANRDKVKDIRSVGDAAVDRVNGDFNKAQKLAIRYSEKTGAFLAGDYCYRKEGQKTLGYELVDQLPGLTHIVVPVGNGTLISGIYKALKEMKAVGKIGAMPAIVAVQSEGSDPVVTAFRRNEEIRYVLPQTAADAIAVGFPTFGNQALEALRETKGNAIAANDSKLKEEQGKFYETYGLVAELAGVAGLAAIRRMNFDEEDKIAVIITGGNV
jgi:threonine synthase